MLRIMEECRNRGHTVVVYTSEWHGPTPNDVEVRIIRASGLTNHTRAAAFHRGLRKKLVHERFDAVIGFNKMPGLDIYYGADYCYVGRAVPRYSLAYRLTPRYHYFQKFEKAVFGKASDTRILCLSEREKSVFQQFYQTPEQRFCLLPPTLDRRQLADCSEQVSRRTRRALNIGDDQNVLLFVGSGFKTKGLDRAISALAALPQPELAKTCLLVVGQDNPKPFLRLAKRLGISDKVRLLGGRSDVPELMRAGDLLVHPAYSENTGTVLLEAITAGLPVLATDVCGYAPHIERAQAGRVLKSPFVQEVMNIELADMLACDERDSWRANGFNYRCNPGLYTMPVCATDQIQQWAEDRNRGRVSATQIQQTMPFLREDLRKSLAGKDSFEDVFKIRGEVYREAPGRQTLRFQMSGKNYFLKSHSGVGWREILKNLLYFRLPVIDARNEWHGIHWLHRIGIDTMNIAGYGTSGRNPARRRSFIITDELPGTISLDEYCQRWRSQPLKSDSQVHFKRWLIHRLAEIARTMHTSNANHRDFYLCHFLVDLHGDTDNPSPDTTDIYVIDLHRMQLRRRTPVRWLVKDIAGLYYSSMDLGLTRHDLFRFMVVYREAPLRQIIEHEAQFWRRVRNRALNLYHSERRKAATQSLDTAPEAVSTTITH